jgi:hypothetical protein
MPTAMPRKAPAAPEPMASSTFSESYNLISVGREARGKSIPVLAKSEPVPQSAPEAMTQSAPIASKSSYKWLWIFLLIIGLLGLIVLWKFVMK